MTTKTLKKTDIKQKKPTKKAVEKPKAKLTEKPTKKLIEKPAEIIEEEKSRYFKGIGRRKTATAQVRLFSKGEKKIIVNNKDYKEYFPIIEMQIIVASALDRMKSLDRFKVEAVVSGGGLHAQAEAIRLGIARALVNFNSDYRKRLKKAGYLKRDPREKERKKFGLKRARRAPQWSKR